MSKKNGSYSLSYKLQLRIIRVFENEKLRHSMDIRVFERSFI